jgi:deoxyribodipyrimidine photo-lyase
MQKFRKSLVWFRRDLRSFDHAALYHALKQSDAVYCVFVFDNEILGKLSRHDRRVEFIHDCVAELDAELRRLGGALIVSHATATEEIPRLAVRLGVDAVFANHDYEPQAIERDARVAQALRASGRSWLTFKDQVIFEKVEVLSQAGAPFSVFTPYKNAWLRKLHSEGGDFYLQPYPVDSYSSRLAQCTESAQHSIPPLPALGFEKTNLLSLGITPGMSGGQALLADFAGRMGNYHLTRDFPAVKGPSYLSVHLRFGTVSIRALARLAVHSMRMDAVGSSGAATWLSELIWRDFYFMILHHHPHVEGRAFKPEYDGIRWETGAESDALFEAWCSGRTGYPLVDAAMAQLNQTGYMHNRLRMVTASFLIKDLGIDWRRGERYFARQLNDYDLAANNGGWQWAASTGCDAQPWFRIFNPVTQSKKFDPKGSFIRRYLPQLDKIPDKFIHTPWLMPGADAPELDYPMPVVQHDAAREKTLARYAVVKNVQAPSGDEV